MSRRNEHQLSFLQLDRPPWGPIQLQEREAPPPDAAARHRIATDTDATLFVEAGAGAGKTTALVGRVLTLVDAGLTIGSIAAITFTEKAAGELRHRLREELSTEPVSPLRQAAIDGLDEAPIGTLHAFARRVLFEFPVEAGLPPGFTVLDELESQLALGERWEDLLDDLLDDADHEVAPGLRAAELVQLCGWSKFGGMPGLLRIVQDFLANWDLVEQRVERTPPRRPDVDTSGVVATGSQLAATPTPPGDRQEDLLARLAVAVEAVARAADVGGSLAGLEAVKAAVGRPGGVGNKQNWRAFGDEAALEALRQREDDLLADIDQLLKRWREYRRLVVGAIAAEFVLAAAQERAADGTLEFHDLLVLARRLLARHRGARRLLHQRYQRVLLDEFQDTDPIQLEIAVRLTALPDDQPADGLALVPVPGRLFVVGDPKQSIYRFRRADISVYLEAGDRIGAERAVLTANFRSTSAVIDWVNGVFGDVIQPAAGQQPAYVPLDVCRPAPREHGTITVLGADVHDGDNVIAQVLREREAAEVAAVVATAVRDGWLVGDGDGGVRPCRPGDIAVLLPARTSLPMLEAALSDLAVPFRAENASVVYVAPEIRHLMLTLKAAADPTDELALVAALRSPLYGCSDVELYDWKAAGGRWNLFAEAPETMAGHPVAAAIAHVRSVARRVGRAGPAELLDSIVEERRVLETALAGPDARDVWRRVRYVVDQARAWTDAGGRSVRRYLRWTAFQAGEGRASDTVLPERDHDAVRVMTVHAAKGLEFPITVVAGLTTRMQGRRAMSVVWPPGSWALAERDSDLFEAFKPLDEQMGDAERRRLLYVACTRAVDHLVVSLHRKPEPVSDGTARATSATALAEAGAAGHGAVVFATPAAALARPTTAAFELPWSDAAEWAAERARVVERASVRSATSATRLAESLGGLLAADDEQRDPGLAKDPVDLDLPPWQRGRYGTAIGRAVHAVLQDADLVSGADIERLSVAQCAAEGIFGFEDRVAALSRSALAAPIVRQAASGAQHWRELFVVAELGDTVLEGYIDLLVRTGDGLLIVDYKTDQWHGPADRVARLARYRRQLAAYGVALRRLLDEPIAGGVLVCCRLDGPAEQLPIERWPAALSELDPP